MEQILTLLTGTLEARDKVLLKLNVTEAAKDKVIALLPSAKSPTIAHLASGDYAVETVVPKRGINTLIPDLIDAGASDLLEIPISKIIH
jgi:ATP phosphoribosyltransferase